MTTTTAEAVDRLINLHQANYLWRNIVERADEAMVRTLERGMANGSPSRNKLVMNAIIDGFDWKGQHFTISGQIKPSSVRFIHHVIATVDVVIRVYGPWDGEYASSYLKPVRTSFKDMSKLTGTRQGFLNQDGIKVARTFTLAAALGLQLHLDDIDYFAERYEALEPYLDIIIDRKAMTHRELVPFLEARPEQALAEGVL